MPELPLADFCGAKLSRLILGDNPFNGHSYVREVYDGGEMEDYYTAERCVAALFEAEANGITAYMALASPFILRVVRQYRNEGGAMKLLFQSYPAIGLEINIDQMMAYDPVAIYHQGGTFDLLCEEEKWDEIRARLELIRKTGVATGLGTHVPETVERAEREGWDVDFYATCLYNARRTRRGEQSGFITGKPKDLVFYPGDPPDMYRAIRNARKPCVAFKVFAGGQIFLNKDEAEIKKAAEAAITDAYENIKPGDLLCIGVFQRDKNQIAENAGFAKRALGRL